MAIEEAIYDYTKAKISGIRLYWEQVPDGSSITRPYVTMSTFASPNAPHYIGERGSSVSLQFSVWASKSGGLVNGLNLANQIYALYDQISGTIGGFIIYNIDTNGPLMLKDPDFDDLFQYIVEIDVHYKR